MCYWYSFVLSFCQKYYLLCDFYPITCGPNFYEYSFISDGKNIDIIFLQFCFISEFSVVLWMEDVCVPGDFYTENWCILIFLFFYIRNGGLVLHGVFKLYFLSCPNVGDNVYYSCLCLNYCDLFKSKVLFRSHIIND